MNIGWVCAAPAEAAIFPQGGGRLWCVGVGKVAATLGLARALGESLLPDLIVNFGVAGAYAGSGLEVGESCIVAREVLVDEGVQTPAGFLDLATLGFGANVGLEADRSGCGVLQAALGRPMVGGATVSCCSGTDALAKAYAERSSASVETMEGGAVATVAQAYGIPWVGLRTVSNRCGDRSRGGWDLPLALERLQHVLERAVHALT